MQQAHSWPQLRTMILAAVLAMSCGVAPALSAPVPGGTLDPLTIPKYVTPLVIPPEMPKSPAASPLQTPQADYNIAVRQFKQQILPGGIWNTVNGRNDTLPATTVWSYGRAEEILPAGFTAPSPVAAGISFNYPAFTIEAQSNQANTVRWINDLKDPTTGNFLPHLFPVDQTLHWANPGATGCIDGMNRTDCETADPTAYSGPVPMVVHVHGSHVNDLSDGYPESWWLPAAADTPAGYSVKGSKYTEFDITGGGPNTVPGSAFYSYENDQPAATLWYHDHTLGMTRLNVYAGPAGFWLVRGGTYDAPTDHRTGAAAVLPGPAPSGSGDPNFNAAYRASIREIPLAIQDRSFNSDGSLFYPQTRVDFDGFIGPYKGASPNSDISPIWNPEAFFNTMVVNGTTWPTLDVAPARYRLRLLNGCNSRFLNLALFQVTYTPGSPDSATFGNELPFYQIGAEQGFLPKVVMIQTGSATQLPGTGYKPTVLKPAADPAQALLMSPAERADVIVDFSALPDGTIVRMVNTAPDAPFGGFPDFAADPTTTGQVMEFRVVKALRRPSDSLVTPPNQLVLNAEPRNTAIAARNRFVTLNEQMSDQVCVSIDPITGAINVLATFPAADPNIAATCAALGGEPMGPRQAQMGTFRWKNVLGTIVRSSQPLKWMDAITENPGVGDTEIWNIYNMTADAHPIHLHLVRFQVLDRRNLDPLTLLPVVGTTTTPTPMEKGYKDTVVAYPGQITKIKATFDKPGLYVWHCHIVEHEDNEMMRPYYVGPIPPGM